MSASVVEIEGLSGATSTFGPGGMVSSVCFQQPIGSTHTLWTMSSSGALNQEHPPRRPQPFNTSTLLDITGSNEVQLNNIQISNGGGIGLDVESADNTDWKTVFVMNWGANDGTESTGPSVRYKTQASNTFDDLHIESTNTGPGGIGIPNILWPLVRVINARNVIFTNLFLYGGPYALIEHARTIKVSCAYQFSSLLILGGSLVGRNPSPVRDKLSALKSSPFSKPGPAFE